MVNQGGHFDHHNASSSSLSIPNGHMLPPAVPKTANLTPRLAQSNGSGTLGTTFPITSSPAAYTNSGGKPTVQVHPMCQKDSNEGEGLTVNVSDQKQSLNRSLIAKTPSPRPPIPKKPDFLLSPANAPGSAYTSQSPRRQELINSMESKCNRLSEYVSEKDEKLKDILQPNQMLTVDCLGEKLGGVNLNGGDRACMSPGEKVYLSTSAHRSKMLADMLYSTQAQAPVTNGLSLANGSSEESSDPFQLERKKMELIGSLSRKLKILSEEEKAIGEEVSMIEKLGLAISDAVQASPTTSQASREKFRAHVEDTEKITNLLLGLSGQLARVENAIGRLPSDATATEKSVLEDRKRRLLDQKEDARNLQEMLEMRGNSVLDTLREVLTEEQLGDYQYFIQMKRKLLIDSREIQDKIKLGMEQKEALENSLHNNSSGSACSSSASSNSGEFSP